MHFGVGRKRNLRTMRAKSDVNPTVMQPIPADLAEALGRYLDDKPTDQTVWPGTWPARAAAMLRIDLIDAVIPYETEEGFADFHALRHSYISLLGQSGIAPKLAQELARHSDIRLTMNVYTHTALYDRAAAVDSLPRLLPPAGEGSEAATVASTGTDGGTGTRLLKGAVDRESLRVGCAQNEIQCDSVTKRETRARGNGNQLSATQPPELIGVADDCDGMITDEKSSGGWDRTTDTRLMKPLL